MYLKCIDKIVGTVYHPPRTTLDKLHNRMDEHDISHLW